MQQGRLRALYGPKTPLSLGRNKKMASVPLDATVMPLYSHCLVCALTLGDVSTSRAGLRLSTAPHP